MTETDLLILEVPFSQQLHRTSKGEYLIRSNDGNRAIEPHEIATIQARKRINCLRSENLGIAIRKY